MTERYTTHLLEKQSRVEDITTFRFERPEGYSYQGGQWFVLTFVVPRAGEGGDVTYEHHFSHSSSPTEPVLELTTRLRGSEFKNALDGLAIGAEVRWEGPYGSFVLDAEAKKVAILTGGIGITCVRSMLKEEADKRAAAAGGRRGKAGRTAQAPAGRSIVLLFANRSERAIPFAEELRQLQDSLPGLSVVHVVSRPEGDWQGYTGHIDEKVLTKELSEPDGWTFYVCGPPTMSRSMRDLLVTWGVQRPAVKLEEFDGYE